MMEKLTRVVDGREIAVYGANKTLLEWVRTLSSRDDFFALLDQEDALFLALGSTTQSERISASKTVINSLWSNFPELGPYPYLSTLAEFEFDRIFYPNYRDHSCHMLKVFLLGLYVFTHSDIVRKALLNEIGTLHKNEGINEFFRRWLVTACYHDIGYVLENQHAERATDEAWKRTRDKINDALAAPLSLIAEFSQLFSRKHEFRVAQKHKIWHPTIEYPRDIEFDGDLDLLELIKNFGVYAGLSPEADNVSPLRKYYDYAFSSDPAAENRPKFRDHGIASSLLLLRTWRDFATYIAHLSKLASEEQLLRNIAPKLAELQQKIRRVEQTIVTAAGAIALHNINKDIWDPGDALFHQLTIENFRLYLEPPGNESQHQELPLAFLLGFVDTLQDWDRPRFRVPDDGENGILSDQDFDIIAQGDRFSLWFRTDQERFKKLDDPESLFAKAFDALVAYLDPASVSSLIIPHGPARSSKSSVGTVSPNFVGQKDKISHPTKHGNDEGKRRNIQSVQQMCKHIQQSRWIVGAVNFDEDLHFSSFYLRQSMRVNLPTKLQEYGYDNLIAIYDNFNETYYIPEAECRQVTESLLKTILRNPLWLQDILEEINLRIKDLETVFPFDPDSQPFSNMPDYELLKYYQLHNEAHERLYKVARIPEALDRGFGLFTEHLKEYLRKRGPDLASDKELNRVFDILTYPEQMSPIGDDRLEFYSLLERILTEEKYRDAFSSSTRRIFLRAEPRLLADVQAYRQKWSYWGYHGYGTRALQDINYFLGRLRRELVQSDITTVASLMLAIERAEEKREQYFEECKIDTIHQLMFRLYSRIGNTKIYRRYIQLRNFYFLDQLLSKISKRLRMREEVIRSLLPEELEAVFSGEKKVTEGDVARTRKLAFALIKGTEYVYTGKDVDEISSHLQEFEYRIGKTRTGRNRLVGTPVSPAGKRRGRCRVVIRPDDNVAREFRRGDILISESTDPDLLELMQMAGAVVTQSGGVTSHAAIICREYGIPAVVGVSNLLESIATGDFLIVDTAEGTITVEPVRRDAFIIHDMDIQVHTELKLGSKAQNLAKLLKAGFKVPSFFVVPLNKLDTAIPKGTPDGVGPESQAFWSYIADALEFLNGDLFALRSSLSTEDQQDMSNAGYYRSELHVAREDVFSTLIKMVSSDERLLEDSSEEGSIIVQEMILGDISGIIFTADPVTQDRDAVIIEIVPGGNELLTGGHIVPVRYEYDKIKRQLSRSEKGDIWAQLANEAFLERLIDTVLRIESLFGCPQDIEWTLKDHQLWILQSRPVTSLKDGKINGSIEYRRRSKLQPVRDITSIYRSYRVPRQLQQHLLQVAGIAAWILDRWRGPAVDRQLIIEALLLHDIGNIVKADYTRFPALLPTEETGNLEYWKAVQNWLMRRYGKTDTEVTYNIAKELNISEDILNLIQNKQFVLNAETMKSLNYERKISAYADQRVSPKGILPLRQRLIEAVHRYQGVSHASVNRPNRDYLIECADGIERQIFEHIDGAPEDIHDGSIQPYISDLKEYQIGSYDQTKKSKEGR